MLDLQKAFDTVDHDSLCKKLKAMGIKSVGMFRSYLSNRNQIVNVNDTESDPLLVTCGVPQGSILGPLLFLCYINDMKLSISSECKFLFLYADDSAILYSNKDSQVISDKLGLELEMCSKWLVDNKLSLHMGKTERIIFGSKRKLRKINIFSIERNGHTIKAQRLEKYLGLTLDDQLTGEAIVKVSKGAKIRNRYNQLPHLTQDTNWKVTNSQLDTTTLLFKKSMVGLNFFIDNATF